MTKVFASEDCGNSPKNLFVQNFVIALAAGDTSFVLSSITDDICWDIVGSRLVQGKDNFLRALEELNKESPQELHIVHVTTHGKVGAVNGTAVLEHGRTVAFCDMLEFSNAKGEALKAITSYGIEIK